MTAWGMVWPGEAAGKQEWVILTAPWTREISITLDQGHDFEFDAKETEFEFKGQSRVILH